MEDTRRLRPSRSTKQGARELTDTNAAGTELIGVYTRSLCVYVIAFTLGVLQNSCVRVNERVSDSCDCSWDSVGFLCPVSM